MYPVFFIMYLFYPGCPGTKIWDIACTSTSHLYFHLDWKGTFLVSNNIISNHSFNIAQSALSSGNHFILLSHQKLKSLGYWKRKPNIFYNDVTTNTKHYNCVDYLSFDFLIQLYNVSTFSCLGCGLWCTWFTKNHCN